MNDLHNPGKALEVWEELLRIDPDAKTANGDSVRDYVAKVKKERGDALKPSDR